MVPGAIHVTLVTHFFRDLRTACPFLCCPLRGAVWTDVQRAVNEEGGQANKTLTSWTPKERPLIVSPFPKCPLHPSRELACSLRLFYSFVYLLPLYPQGSEHGRRQVETEYLMHREANPNYPPKLKPLLPDCPFPPFRLSTHASFSLLMSFGCSV